MKNKQKIQEKYLKRAERVAKLLMIVPFIRMVGLNGSLARREAKETSDIDFLIIAKVGRIWTCRVLVTILVHLTGYRRYGNHVAGRICLNRYQTDDFLEIWPHNDYHARVFSQLIPLLDIDNSYEKYIDSNSWMKKLGWPIVVQKPNIGHPILDFYRQRLEEVLSSKFGAWLEKQLKSYQIKRIKKDVRTKESPAGRIRISDQELCFHPIDISKLKNLSDLKS